MDHEGGVRASGAWLRSLGFRRGLVCARRTTSGKKGAEVVAQIRCPAGVEAVAIRLLRLDPSAVFKAKLGSRCGRGELEGHDRIAEGARPAAAQQPWRVNVENLGFDDAMVVARQRELVSLSWNEVVGHEPQ